MINLPPRGGYAESCGGDSLLYIWGESLCACAVELSFCVTFAPLARPVADGLTVDNAGGQNMAFCHRAGQSPYVLPISVFPQKSEKNMKGQTLGQLFCYIA